MDVTLRQAVDAGKLDMRYYLEDPDPILSTNCAPVEPYEFDETLAAFGKLLLAKLNASGNGIGLAAPQVHVLRRVFVMSFPETKRKQIVVVNPIVIPQGGDKPNECWVYNEGCLSIPGVYNQVRRPKDIIMRYQDVDGDEQKIELTMLEARVAQHENDHINGIMFFDRMMKNMRKHTLREWEKEKLRRGKDLFGVGRQI